ncbi:MAG: 50S ribosomal protein L3 [Candidatus Neomarinimicrobiota bacterium]
MRGLIGRKIGMSQIYMESGEVVPMTLLEVGPCVVTQVKTKQKDGYDAVQLGFGDVKEKHTTKPLSGHFKKAGVESKKVLAEFVTIRGFDYELGQQFTVSIFKTGDFVDVTGKSKGKGFAGVIKRHNFKRQPETHGQKNTLRHPGSIGQASDPSRVFKGMRMGGHMGNEKVTVKNLEVFAIDADKNQMMVKGAIPGASNGIVYIVK